MAESAKANPFDALEEGARETKADRPPAWKPAKGEVMRGFVTEIAYPYVKIADEHRFVVTIEDESKELHNVWLSSNVLLDQFMDAAPAIGSPVVIVFNGKIPNKDGTREYNSYSVKGTESAYEQYAQARTEGLRKAELRAPDSPRIEVARDANGNIVPDDAPF